MSAVAYASPREPVDEPAARLEFLRSAAAWPGESTVPQLIETHISWVFLGERHAYKLKKPVSFGFVDFSTRRAARRGLRTGSAIESASRRPRFIWGWCRSRSTPVASGASAGMALWMIGWSGCGVCPPIAALDRLLEAGTVADRDIDALTSLLADFYASLPPLPIKAADYRDSIAARHAARQSGRPRHAAPPLPIDLIERTQSTQLRLLGLYPEWWEHRVCDGRIVEGHGDLRPEHIILRRGRW
jgi:aminoglycoside phosphotransferase family enzyme